MRTLHPLSTASLIAMNSGGSNDTAKFTVMFFGNDAPSKRWSNNEPESTDAARNHTPVRARYGTVFVTTSLKTGGPTGRNDEYRT